MKGLVSGFGEVFAERGERCEGKVGGFGCRESAADGEFSAPVLNGEVAKTGLPEEAQQFGGVGVAGGSRGLGVNWRDGDDAADGFADGGCPGIFLGSGPDGEGEAAARVQPMEQACEGAGRIFEEHRSEAREEPVIEHLGRWYGFEVSDFECE